MYLFESAFDLGKLFAQLSFGAYIGFHFKLPASGVRNKQVNRLLRVRPHGLSLSLCVLACSTTTLESPLLESVNYLPFLFQSFPWHDLFLAPYFNQCAKSHSDFIARWISLLKFLWEKMYKKKGGKLVNLSRRLLSNDSIASCEGHSSINCRGRVFVKRINHPSPEVQYLG